VDYFISDALQLIMKKSFLETFILYPILFPVNIVLTLAAANLVNLAYREIIEYALAAIVLAGIFLGIAYAITKDIQRAGFLVFIGTIWLAYFGLVVGIIRRYTGLPMIFVQQMVFLVIWSALFGLLASPWLWRKVRKPGLITSYMNVLSIVLVAVSIYKIQAFMSRQSMPADFEDPYPKVSNLQSPAHPPDIYYIIVDGYGRADVLSEIYGWDNTEFTDYLTQKGFYVASQSQSNYVQTALSLSSSLNFGYLPDLPENSRDGRVLVSFIQNNRVIKAFEELGYTTYAFQSFYEATNIVQVDHYLFTRQVFISEELLGLLMIDSVVSPFMDIGLIKAPLSTYRDQQNLVRNTLSDLDSLSEKPGPKFVFLHLLIPHPPFIFNAQGPIFPDNVYTLVDAELFQGTIQQYITGYIAQVNYLNQALIKSIDVILANSASSPVIIIQGDHGPGAMFRQTVEQTCLEERFGILNAYLLPGVQSDHLYPSISPVNTFRLILDEYFGANLDLLPDKHFYSNFLQPVKFIEIKDESDQGCKYP
jgi:hypothetical protein